MRQGRRATLVFRTNTASAVIMALRLPISGGALYRVSCMTCLPLDRARLLNTVAGGWEISGIFTYQGGFPVTPLVSGDNSQTLTYADRPNVILGAPIFLPGEKDPSQWFNPAAFIVAPLGQFGNAGKGIIRGPGLVDLDFALLKNFRFAERYNLQVRGEVFNAANHPNFAGPNSYINTPSAGTIGSTTTTSRQIQLGMKLTF